MWYLDSTRIYVREMGGEDQNVWASLTPFSGGSIRQYFGYEDETLKIVGLVAGWDNLTALKAMAKDSSMHTLSGYGRLYGDYDVSKVVWKAIQTVSHTLTENCYDPLYEVEVELLEP